MLNWVEYRKELLGRIGEIGQITPDTVKGYKTLSAATTGSRCGWRSAAIPAAEPGATSTTARSNTGLFADRPYSLIVRRTGLIASVGGISCSVSTRPAPTASAAMPSSETAAAQRCGARVAIRRA